MLPAGPYRSEWPVLSCKAMLTYVSEVHPRTMSESMALLQQESLLMFVSPVTIKFDVNVCGLDLHLGFWPY